LLDDQPPPELFTSITISPQLIFFLLPCQHQAASIFECSQRESSLGDFSIAKLSEGRQQEAQLSIGRAKDASQLP
jgi:hypothetical protein